MPNTSRHFVAGMLGSLLLAIAAAPLGAQKDPMAKGTVYEFDRDTTMTVSDSTAIKWTDLVVEGFDPGLKLAVIHGDPSGTGDYTVRLQFPDGYRFPGHWHPNAEHLTVLSGSFILGMGTTVNAAGEKTYAPGDFLYIPAKQPHFGGVKGATVIQLHGIGPFTINLGAPPK